MTKKVIKVVLVMLILLGLVISASNVLEEDLNAAPGKWVEYHPDEPDCRGVGTSCYDMTNSGTVK